MRNFKYFKLSAVIFKFKFLTFNSGFLALEAILAAALFVIFSSGAIAILLQGFDANRLGSEETIANQYASEGIEATRSIKNQAYSNLIDTTGTGASRSASNVWSFSGTNNTFSKYTRVITISDVLRDSNGNIVASGGSFDPNTKKVTSTVSWNESPTRNDSVVLTSYLTNWKGYTGKGGMLVYGDGGTTTSAIKYRLFDGASGTWDTASATANIDTGSTNKVLQAVKLYSSSTRNEKILISSHYNGTAQFIYAQVWNGTSWGNVVQLATWTATTFLGVQNFDGTYLSDGTFMVIYSDNTVIPKYQIWNGTSWSAQGSLTTLGTSQIPSYIVARARPGTTEVMAAFFTQGTGSTAGNTITQYWSGTAWSAITTHSTAAPLNTKKIVDFAWSPNSPTIGALVYANSATDKNLITRLFVANGTGGGAWGTAVTAGTAQTNNLGSLSIVGRPGANEFQVCNKDSGTTPTIICQEITFSGNATSGYTVWNGTFDSGNGNMMSSSQVTTSSASGALQSITIYMGTPASSPLNHIQVALYTNNGSNSPGTLLASSGSYTIIPNSWNTIPITGVTISANTKYFLAFNLDSSTTQFGWNNTSAGISQWENTITFGTWPSSFGTPTNTATQQYAIYMTYSSSGIIPAITNPTNATIASATDMGIQKSYDIGFESLSGNPSIAVYSDTTAIPKMKKYSASTSTWDASATSISTGAFSPGVIKSVRVIPQPDTNDIMILIADANLDFYSAIWDGTNNIVYTAPVGKAFSQQGLNGSATTNFWYDFSWNQF